MNTLDHLQHRIHKTWNQLAEGWRQLRSKTVDALTYFRPRPLNEGRQAADRHMQESSRWGLLTADTWIGNDSITVSLEVPGMEKEDMDITVRDGRLSVRGIKRSRSESSNGYYHAIECAYGEFERTISLPEDVEEEKARAQYRNGVLTITLPRLRGGGMKKHIPVDAD